MTPFLLWQQVRTCLALFFCLIRARQRLTHCHRPFSGGWLLLRPAFGLCSEGEIMASSGAASGGNSRPTPRSWQPCVAIILCVINLWLVYDLCYSYGLVIMWYLDYYLWNFVHFYLKFNYVKCDYFAYIYIYICSYLFLVRSYDPCYDHTIYDFVFPFRSYIGSRSCNLNLCFNL